MADEEIKKDTAISMGEIKLFYCNFCNECYSQERSFKLHYRAHKKISCETCGKVFFLKRELTAHSRSHDQKVYTCEVCNKVFNFKLGLKRHERIHNAEKSHICNVCKSTFRKKVELKKHYSTHAAEGPYVCDICQACFQEKSGLQAHTFTHITKKNNSDEVNDSIEGKIVKESAEPKNSQSNHKGIAQHKCDICEKVFKTKTLLKNHCHIHKGKKSRKGNIAERALNELPSSTNHTVEKLHVCDICKKVFKTKTLLKNHYHIHNRKESLKGNITERALSELPSSTNHTVEKLHVCDICKKVFKTKTLLKNHYHIHNRKESLKGNITERALSELLSSTNRTVGKPHVCDLCQKSFSRKSSLMSHGCTNKRKA